jgi:hypothetical protein
VVVIESEVQNQMSVKINHYYFTSNTNAHMNPKQKVSQDNAIVHTSNQPSSKGEQISQ